MTKQQTEQQIYRQKRKPIDQTNEWQKDRQNEHQTKKDNKQKQQTTDKVEKTVDRQK